MRLATCNKGCRALVSFVDLLEKHPSGEPKRVPINPKSLSVVPFVRGLTGGGMGSLDVVLPDGRRIRARIAKPEDTFSINGWETHYEKCKASRQGVPRS